MSHSINKTITTDDTNGRNTWKYVSFFLPFFLNESFQVAYWSLLDDPSGCKVCSSFTDRIALKHRLLYCANLDLTNNGWIIYQITPAVTINAFSTHIYLFLLKGKKVIQSPSEGFSTSRFSPVGLWAERPWNDVKNSQYFFFLRSDKQRNKHTKCIMDSVICRINAGVGAAVATKDYLLETQNKHTQIGRAHVWTPVTL